MSVKLDPSH